MQVSSTNTARLANIPLSLQSTRPHNDVDRTVSAVGEHAGPQDYLAQQAPPPEPKINVDPGTEKKLGRIKEVQVAFKAALTMANSIENQYLLEPII